MGRGNRGSAAGKCWATVHEHSDRPMLEVMAMPADRLPFLDVQQAFRGRPRDEPTHKAKRKARTGCEPAHNATLNILALALIKRSAHFATVPQGMANYIANREAALEVLQPQLKGNAAHAAGQPHGPRSGPVG